MPVSFSSPPRNLFLLGSSGADAVTNFFHEINKSTSQDEVFIPDEIRYDYGSDRYNLAGTAQGSGYNNVSKKFGWLERRDYDPDLDGTPPSPSSTNDWSVKVIDTQTTVNVDTTLRAMESYGNDLVVVGKTGQIPWIAKYTNNGGIVWTSTSNTANVEYTGVCSDGVKYYACGSTPDTGSNVTNNQARAFVEKYDEHGNPSWGKSAVMLGRDVVLQKISVNSRGHVIAVGYLEDDSANKGYIVKIDANTGQVLWDRTLERNISGSGGGISNDNIAPADVRCTATYIDGNDFIYVVGSIDGKNPVNNGVGEFLVKYSPEGNILWQRENNTEHYTALDSGPNMIPFDVKSDTDTQQTVVLSVEDQGSFALNNSDIFISKYSKDGTLVFRRKISKGSNNLGAASLDADSSFYYILFRDQQINSIAGTPDRYFFGKVSTSGNGLGNFQYDDGGSTPVDYTININAENKIGRLSDGSVRNDSSDFITYPFTASKIVFDDLATPVSNKKRQMDSADSFEYSGSPAIRPADFSKFSFGSKTRTETTDAPDITPYWYLNYGSETNYATVHKIALDSSNNVYICGTYDPPGGGIDRTYLAKWNSDGVFQWQTYIQDVSINFYGIAFDNSDNILVSGQSSGFQPGESFSNFRMLTVKYNSSGVKQWDRELTSVASGSGSGQQAYTTPGNYTWTAPAGVTSVSVVCVGGGSGCGGALAYKNNITVVPGTGYSVVVGDGGVNTGGAGNATPAGGDSSFTATHGTTTAQGGRASSSDGSTKGSPAGNYDGGGNGGISYGYGRFNGGGAGGYSGNGGGGGPNNATGQYNGSGGGGGAGHWAYAAGGGVGIFGEGASGAGGASSDQNGQGGSGGQDGQGEGVSGTPTMTGGLYGGGCSSRWSGNQGGSGAVRIIWGAGRAFPSTNTADINPQPESDQKGFAIDVDQFGNSYNLGYSDHYQDSNAPGGGQDWMLLAKYNATGVLQWQKWLRAGAYFDRGHSISVNQETSEVYIVGVSYDRPGTFGGSTNVGSGFASGDSPLGGSYGNNNSDDDILVAKYDYSGNLVWTRIIGTDGGDLSLSDRNYDIKSVGSSGDVWVATEVGSNSTSGVLNAYGYIMLTKFNSSGTEQWSRVVGSTSTLEQVRGVDVDSSGNAYVIGVTSTDVVTRSSWDVVILKFNSSGTLLWQRTLSGPGSEDPRGPSIQVDDSNNFYISFMSNPAGSSSDSNSHPNIFKFPTDGSETGTHGDFVYAASSFNDASRTSFGSSTYNSTDAIEVNVATAVSSNANHTDYAAQTFTEGSETLSIAKTNIGGGPVETTFVVDESGNGFDGEVNGATLNSSGYWEFDGVDDFIMVDDPQQKLQFVDTDSDFAIECWVRRTATGSGSLETMLSTWGQAVDKDGWIFSHGNGTLEFVWSPHSQDQIFFTGGTLNLNTWHHAMVTKNGNTFTMYVDGVSVATATSSGTMTTTYSNLEIGHYGNNATSWFTGNIGEVRIYFRGLTAAAIFQNYNATKSKYINEAPDTAPRISSDDIVYDSNLILNYDFGNRATYDRAENVVRHSEDFKVDEDQTWGDTNTNWLDKSKLTSNYAMSPFGEMTATRVANDTGSDKYLNYRANYSGNGSIDVSGQWTVSAFVKPLSNPCTIQLTQWDGITESRGVFNLVSGTLSSSNATDANTIEEVGGGWYRISSTATNGNTNTAFQIKFFDGTDLLLYGAQMERGSTLGRYIRTYGTAITAPTTVKNLSSNLLTGTADGCTFNSDGYFEFDGSNDEISVPDSNDFPFGTNDFTMEFWGYMDSLPGSGNEYGMVGQDGIGSDGGAAIRWKNDGGTMKVIFILGGVGSMELASTLPAGQWIYCACGRRSGTTGFVNVNGVDITTSSFSGSLNNSTNPFYIGRSIFTSRYLDGRIGEVRVYNRGLSSSEVSVNYLKTKSKYGL